MGWTYTSDFEFSGISIAQYLKDHFTEENEHGKWEILDHSLVSRVWYAALRWTDKSKDETRVLCMLCLVRHCPKDQEGYTLGYKELSEDMGPCDFKCPLRILDKLDPPSNENARDWREKVRAYHLKNATKPKVGDTFIIKDRITFSDQQTRYRFKAERYKKRAIAYRCLEDNILCRISGIMGLSFEIESRGGKSSA